MKIVSLVITVGLLVTGLALWVPPVDAGSRAWSLEGPDGGIPDYLFVSPSKKNVWMVSRGFLFRYRDTKRAWESVPLDTTFDFVRSVAFSPDNDEHILVSTSRGRVLRSFDGGQTWEAAVLVPGLLVWHVAVDPFDSSHALASISSIAAGLFETRDFGATWKRRGLEGVKPGKIYFDPNQEGHVYVASSNSGTIFLTTDGGATYKRLSGALGGFLEPIDLHLGNTTIRKNVMFAGTTSGVIKSVDGGRRWHLAGFRDAVTGLAIRRDGVIIAASLRGLWAGDPRGDTFEQLIPKENPLYGSRFDAAILRNDLLYLGSTIGGVQTTSTLGLSFNAQNRGFKGVSLLSLDVDETTGDILVGASSGAGLYLQRGDDLWRRWQETGRSLNLSAPRLLAVRSRQDRNKLYVASTNGGIIYSTDEGENWTSITLNTSGALPLRVVLPPGIDGPDGLVMATNLGVFQFRREVNAWVKLFPESLGEATELVYNPENPDRVYLGTEISLYRSDDGGTTMVDLSKPVRDLFGDPPGDPLPLYVQDIALDPTDPRRLLVSFRDRGVWQSRNGGNRLDPYIFIEAPESFQSLAISPRQFAHQYFGTLFNGVIRTANGGKDFESFSDGQGYPNILELVFDRKRPLTLYARLRNLGLDAYTFGDVPDPEPVVPGLGAAGVVVLLLLFGLLLNPVCWRKLTSQAQ